MVIGAIGSFMYNVFLLLHIMAVIVAFAPNFVWPFVSVRLKRLQRPVGSTINDLSSGNTAKIAGPAMVLAGVFGFGLAGMSDQVYKMSQTWLSIAILLWILAIAVIYGLMVPAERKIAQGDDSVESRISMAGGMLHLLLFLLLIVMIWKPGFP